MKDLGVRSELRSVMNYLTSGFGSEARTHAYERCNFNLQLAALCIGILSGVAAHPATISGAVKVVIQPAEAITDGARWSIDGGAPQVSGASVTNLDAGTQTIEFADLAVWREPDMVEVLVIGGKLSTMSATYRPMPKFYFRSVPEQRPRVGTLLELLVQTDDPGDPRNPGPGPVLQIFFR